MSKIKVLHIITRLDKGGSSENTLLTGIGLDKNRFEVSLLAGETVVFDNSLIKEAESSGVNFIFLPELVRQIRPFKDIKALFKIHSIIKREKFDIVHVHSSKAGFIGRLAAKLAGVRIIIYTPHGHIFYGYFNWFVSRIFILLEKLSAGYTDRIITLTETGKQEWLKFGIGRRDKLTVIHSGIRLSAFQESIVDKRPKKGELGISIGTKIVGTIGRFVPIKGHKYLIKAIPEVIDKYPEVIFFLVGDGSLKADLKREVQTLGVGEKVRFLGWRDDLPELLALMDIFVLPSLNEGMGRVLVEAMACSLPVAATKVGGIPDVVEDGKTGLLLSPAQPGSLSRAIVELLKNPKQAKIMGEKGKEIATANFTYEKMIKQTDELYQDLLRDFHNA